MTEHYCPYLGTHGDDDVRGAALDYPSFEHHCFALDQLQPAPSGPDRGYPESDDHLLLADQATYCLGSSYELCPRYHALHGNEVGRNSPPPAAYQQPAIATDKEDSSVPANLPGTVTAEPAAGAPLAGVLDVPAGESREPRVRGATFLNMWAGIAVLVLGVLLCGGSLAVYAGWQLVGQGIVTLVERNSTGDASQVQEPVVIRVTETPDPIALQSTLPTPGGSRGEDAGQAAATSPDEPAPTFAFPAAVTATAGPALVDGDDASAPLVITTPEPTVEVDPAGEEEPAPELATAVSGPLVISTPAEGLPTPTRRATPTFEVPTSTPGEPDAAVVTATPTPEYVEPTVNFRTAHQSVQPGDCTILYWEVENARAVILDGEGVVGRGERQICLRSESQTYNLAVLSLDGTQTDHEVIVEVVLPTPTPTITPTNTPVLTPTPTWTPEGTPSPSAEPPEFGVTLTAEGGNQKLCTPGQTCEAAIQVRNTGDLTDEFFVDLAKSGPWQVLLCREDDICADTSLTVAIGAGVHQMLFLRAELPEDAGQQSHQFTLTAASGNSGRTVRSNPLTITMFSQSPP